MLAERKECLIKIPDEGLQFIRQGNKGRHPVALKEKKECKGRGMLKISLKNPPGRFIIIFSGVIQTIVLPEQKIRDSIFLPHCWVC